MARRVSRRVIAKLRGEGKLPTRTELQAMAEINLRDAMAHTGKVSPAAMSMAYRRGLSVETICGITGYTPRRVKESIVESDSRTSEPQGTDEAPPFGGTATDGGPSEPSPPEQPEQGVKAARAQPEQGEQTADDGPDLGAYSDGELVERGSALRQAGNADEAAYYDHELERRQSD